MATIQVYKHGSSTLLGSGQGSIDKSSQTATIQSWDSKAGLQVGTQYKLVSSGKTYSDANCTAVSPNAPVATFDNVS